MTQAYFLFELETTNQYTSPIIKLKTILFMKNERNTRTLLLLGEEKFEKLQQAHVLIVGLGGVGGYAAEQICRAGVGKLTIVDADEVNESNINRQIIAMYSTIGLSKTEVMKTRLKDINPDVIVNDKKFFITGESAEELLAQDNFDFVVDAVDTLAPKVNLIKACLSREIPLVSSMGAGGRFDPSKVNITDISKTHNCSLARTVRKRLHKSGIRKGFNAVFSSETVSNEVIIEERSRNKNTNVGTISYMPAVFGIYCASVVIRGLIGKL
jgi:tRNA A37 threonylcarbamoyladenosine dehydratase